MRAQFIASETLLGIRRNVTMILSVIIVVAVSSFLLGAALLIRDQVEQAKGYWYDKVQVTVYLCTDSKQSTKCPQRATEAEKNTIRQTLLGMQPTVQKVYYESQRDAYERFKQLFKDQPALVQNTSPDAIPDSFRVKLADPRQSDVVQSAVGTLPGVDTVYDEHKALKPLFHFSDLLRNAMVSVAVVVLIAAILMMIVTTRLAFFGRRREVGIMRLVGASNLYIELPFILEAVLAGVLGGVIGWAGLPLLKHYLFNQFGGTITSIVGWNAVIDKLWILVALGAVFSAAASWATLRRYLKV